MARDLETLARALHELRQRETELNEATAQVKAAIMEQVSLGDVLKIGGVPVFEIVERPKVNYKGETVMRLTIATLR